MTQGTLFPDTPSTPAQAAAGRDEGIGLAVGNAGELWKAAALAWIEAFLRSHAEYVPDRDNWNGPQPLSRRAWGAVTQHALRSGWVERIGYAPRLCGHGTPGPVYRSLLFQGA